MILDIFDRLNDISRNTNNFVKDFMKELNDALKERQVTYCVGSELNEKGEFYVVRQDGSGAGKMYKAEDLPEGTQDNTVFRYINGKFKIDEKLTEERITHWEQAIKETKELVDKYRIPRSGLCNQRCL